MQISITVSGEKNDPEIGAFLENLLQKARQSGLGTSISVASSTSEKFDLGTNEELHFNLLWQHLTNQSRAFLKNVVKFCVDTESTTFTLHDISSISQTPVQTVRAANRNIHRSLKKEGGALFAKKWDHRRGCQAFTVRQEMLDAMRSVVGD